jgi:hypothetical protein
MYTCSLGLFYWRIEMKKIDRWIFDGHELLVVGMTAAIGLLLMAFCSYNCSKALYNAGAEQANKMAIEQQEAKDNNYKCYLDGKEVDINNVDLSMYNCKVDTENKKVYITK